VSTLLLIYLAPVCTYVHMYFYDNYLPGAAHVCYLKVEACGHMLWPCGAFEHTLAPVVTNNYFSSFLLLLTCSCLMLFILLILTRVYL
jgi:hypothetical protein